MDGLILLNKAQSAGLTVEAQGDRLFIKGPKRAEAVAKELIDRKTVVMAALTLIPKPDGQTLAIVPSSTGHFCDGNNSKLGKGLMTFDMSPIVSCPGCRHALCKELRPDCNATEKPICWAFRDRYREKAKKERLATNLLFSRSDLFVPWANGVIGRRRTVKAVRLPGIGDMYDVDFVRKVHAIVQANPTMRFWCYTRCWAVPEIWKELKTLKGESNMSLWLSWDRMMAEHDGPPPDRDFPWCWLAEHDGDLPPEPVAIVWRFNSQSSAHVKLPERHILGNSLVCLHEDGASKTTCMTCGICWRGEKFRTAKIGKLLEKHQPVAKG